MEVVGSIDDNPRKPLKITIMRKLLVDDDSNIANISPNDEDNQDEAKNTSRKRQKKYYSQGQPQEETLDDDKIRAYRLPGDVDNQDHSAGNTPRKRSKKKKSRMDTIDEDRLSCTETCTYIMPYKRKNLSKT
ncbi:hypothetical protein PRIPAC_78559, partial [Pristionchus pacificus]|uniref:Uncharacterized protein n=1 Tax=Pristionchus pacificus TaxID=54126 RepID=A0A2A6BI29_PRIPA